MIVSSFSHNRAYCAFVPSQEVKITTILCNNYNTILRGQQTTVSNVTTTSRGTGLHAHLVLSRKEHILTLRPVAVICLPFI